MRIGECVVEEDGDEFFVYYNLKGKEMRRERTFHGVRLMVVGNENVGKVTFLTENFLTEKFFVCSKKKKSKTSFKTRLMGFSSKDNLNSHREVLSEKREEDMTHGVNVFILKDESQKNLFSIWDFAGIKIFKKK